MANYVIQQGATDVTINVVWVTKADGTYATVAHDAAGISVAYVRTGFDDAAISLAALADPDIADDAHADGQMGVVYAGGGIHRLDLPDAVCADGIDDKQRIITICGESDAAEMLPVTIQLTLGAPGPASVDVGSISGDTTAADVLELFAEALDQSTGQLDSGSLANGTITANSIASDALTAAKIAADVTTELQSGLATAASLATVAGYLDTEIAAILEDTTEIGVAGAGLTALATAAALATVDSEVGVIDGIVDTITANVTTLLGADVVVKKNVARTNNMVYMELTDGSPGTGLTVAGEISKDGAAFAGLGGSVTEVSDGWYKYDLAQAELNADTVALFFTATGAKQRNLLILTQS